MALKKKKAFTVPFILPPWEDGVFKSILTHPDGKPVLIDVLSSILGFPVVDVKFLPNQTAISQIDEKRSSFDVICQTKDGQLVNVEMQSKPMDEDSQKTDFISLRNRLVLYLDKLFMSQKN
jgi:predicted transposase/invertase (TIGR01784 family)